MTTIKIRKIHSDAIIPKYAHKGDSGMDVFSIEDFELKPLERKLFKTGLSFEIPLGYEIQVRPKSGLALKHGLTIVNTPGTIDSGYRGELGVILLNTDKNSYYVKKREKIAQIVLQKVEEMKFEEVKNLDDTSRGEGGFGSTGIN